MYNLIGISGKMNSGKDVIGKIIQYLDSGADEKYTFEEYCDSIIGTFGIGYESEFEIKKFADKLKDIVCILIGCSRKDLEDRDFKEKELGKEWWYYKAHSGLCKYTPYDEREGIREQYFDLIKPTPRLFLQLIGTECGRQIIHPNVWVNATLAGYKTNMYFMCDRCGNQNIPDLLEIPSRFKEQRYLENEFVCPHCKGEESESDITTVLTDNYSKWIITDVRFPNEVTSIQEKGGIVIRVDRPCKECGGTGYHKMDCGIGRIEHESETALDDYKGFDYTIINNKTLENLFEVVKNIIK